MAKTTKKPKKAAKARKPGRQTIQTPELLHRIGMGLADGSPMTLVCERLALEGTKVAPRTVRDWEAASPDVAAAIARAREEGEMAIASRLRQTARGKGPDDGGDSTGDVQRDKLIVDLDLKLLAKFNPKRWGDKVQLADAEGNKLPPAPQFILAPVAPGPAPAESDD